MSKISFKSLIVVALVSMLCLPVVASAEVMASVGYSMEGTALYDFILKTPDVVGLSQNIEIAEANITAIYAFKNIYQVETPGITGSVVVLAATNQGGGSRFSTYINPG